MGFFGNKSEEGLKTKEEVVEKEVVKEEIVVVKTPHLNLSNLNNLLKVEADIDGQGSLIIGGIYDGSVKIEETLIIEKGALFNGRVKAKNVRIAGEFIGEVDASVVEVSVSSKFEGIVNANKVILAGVFNGVVNSKDSIEVLVSGNVETKEFKSSNIKISGKIKGNIIASTMLEVTKYGSVNGEIVTKGIKTEQGGTIIGNIQTYDESLHGIDIDYSLEDIKSNNQTKKESKLENSLDEIDIQKYSKKDEKNPKRI